MCIFKRKKITLPHPEEPKLLQPATGLESVRIAWLTGWAVPMQFISYWMGINLELTPDVAVADTTDAVTRVNPYWATPGVLAHEMAHRSYAFLTDPQKAEFAAAYHAVKDNDPLIVYLYSINTYGLQSDIEGHAEVYRYIGGKMPEQLKAYYPKLF